MADALPSHLRAVIERVLTSAIALARSLDRGHSPAAAAEMVTALTADPAVPGGIRDVLLEASPPELLVALDELLPSEARAVLFGSLPPDAAARQLIGMLDKIGGPNAVATVARRIPGRAALEALAGTVKTKPSRRQGDRLAAAVRSGHVSATGLGFDLRSEDEDEDARDRRIAASLTRLKARGTSPEGIRAFEAALEERRADRIARKLELAVEDLPEGNGAGLRRVAASVCHPGAGLDEGASAAFHSAIDSALASLEQERRRVEALPRTTRGATVTTQPQRPRSPALLKGADTAGPQQDGSKASCKCGRKE